jgi:hypothetical protein
VSKMTLFEIEERLQVLADSEPEASQLELVQEWLADMGTAKQEAVAKRDRTIQFLRHMDLQGDAIDKEIDRLQGLKKGYAAGVKRLKEYVVSVMQESGQKKLEGTVGRLVLMENPSTAEVEDVDKLTDTYIRKVIVTCSPEAYRRLVQSDLDMHGMEAEKMPDKAAILKDLKAGNLIRGCDLRFGSQRVDVK